MKLNTEKLLFTELGEEGVILDLETNEYLSVNETYYQILKKIGEEKSLETVVAELCEEYDVETETCTTEVTRVVAELKERNFIH
jgi:hypothetical protein